MTASANKDDIRQTARTARDTAAASTPDAAARVSDIFIKEMPDLPAEGVVAGYWPIGSELDPRPLMKALADTGYALALPVVVNRKSPLIFRQWTPEAPVIEGPYGIPEPIAGTAALVTPDLVLVPLLAFDDDGTRLGYGGGFYDRTLKDLRERSTLKAVGLAYSGQRHPALPCEAHDQKLDAIVTETGWIKKPST